MHAPKLLLRCQNIKVATDIIQKHKQQPQSLITYQSIWPPRHGPHTFRTKLISLICVQPQGRAHLTLVSVRYFQDHGRIRYQFKVPQFVIYYANKYWDTKEQGYIHCQIPEGPVPPPSELQAFPVPIESFLGLWIEALPDLTNFQHQNTRFNASVV